MVVAPASPVPSTISPLLKRKTSLPCSDDAGRRSARGRKVRNHTAVLLQPAGLSLHSRVKRQKRATLACAMASMCWKKASTSG